MKEPNYGFGINSLVAVIVIILLIGCTVEPQTVEIIIGTPEPETINHATSTRVQNDIGTNELTFSSAVPTAITNQSSTLEPTVVETANPERTVTPVATAARIFPLSWSPNSEMLAYWTFTDEEVALDFTLPPGTLNFFNVSTGESCQSSIEVAYGYFSPTLFWLPDGRVQLLVEDGTMAGTPCQDDFKVIDGSQYNVSTDLSLSPSGDYRVHTNEIESTRFKTTLTNESTGELLAAVDWQTIAALGNPGLGGQWLTPDEFLIQQSTEGPLLVSIKGEVIPVAAQIFNQSVAAICDVATCETTLAAIGITAGDGDTYHLVLYGKGVETNFPPIRLYHSENDLVEELDFRQHGGFSPDGRTLLLLATDVSEKLVYSLALRAIDPPASEPLTFLTSATINPLPVVWSPDSTMLATNSANNIIIFSNIGEVIARYDVADWESTMPTVWSPNSQYLAVRGLSSSTIIPSEEALFIVSVKAQSDEVISD